MDIFLKITDKVRELCIKQFGFQVNEDGFLTKTLDKEEDFTACPTAIMYGFFLDAFDDNSKQAYYHQLKEGYYTFRLGKAINNILFTEKEQKWLDEVNADDELYHWDHLMDWLSEETVLIIDKPAADMYYEKIKKEWEE